MAASPFGEEFANPEAPSREGILFHIFPFPILTCLSKYFYLSHVISYSVLFLHSTYAHDWLLEHKPKSQVEKRGGQRVSGVLHLKETTIYGHQAFKNQIRWNRAVGSGSAGIVLDCSPALMGYVGSGISVGVRLFWNHHLICSHCAVRPVGDLKLHGPSKSHKEVLQDLLDQTTGT